MLHEHHMDKHAPEPPRHGFNRAVYLQPDRIVDADTGRTLLIEAILAGDRDRIKGLLASGASPGKADKAGKTPLHHAAALGQTETIGLLLQEGAPINPRDKTLSTPLFDALESPHPLETLARLLEAGADADIANDRQRVPLHTAAQKSGREVVRLLARATENPGRPDKSGMTPLHEACQKNGLEAVQALLAAGVTAFCANNEGDTPLHMAARRADNPIAAHLINAGAGPLVSAVNIEGQTPLHEALRFADKKLVEQMLQAGADANLKNRQGESPLHLAVRCRTGALVTLLIEYGADVGKTPPSVMTPVLLLAIETGQTEVAQVLLDCGADPDIVNSYGLSSLQAALLRGTPSDVRMLLKAGANPNLADRNGATPLHQAVYAGESSLESVRLLLAAGADPSIKDLGGQSACDLAHNYARRSHLELFKKKLGELGIPYAPPPPPSRPPWMGDQFSM